MVMNQTGYGALLAVMLVTCKIMALTAIAGRMIDPKAEQCILAGDGNHSVSTFGAISD